MKYRKEMFDFRLQAVPQSAGELNRLLRYNSTCKIGALVAYLMTRLVSVPGVMSAKHTINLVNVTNRHSGYSWGACPPPPKACVAINKSIDFTFSLTWFHYTKMDVPKHIRLQDIDTKVWDVEGPSGKNKYVTINVIPSLLDTFGLDQSFFLTWYLYNVVGILTKSEFSAPGRIVESGDTVKESLRGIDTDAAYNRYYLRPLNSMLALPYTDLVFNRQIWLSCPNLLMPDHFVPETIFYFLRNIRGKILDSDIAEYWDIMRPQIEASLVSTNQARSQKRPLFKYDVLWAAYLDPDLTSGYTGLDSELLKMLAARAKTVDLPDQVFTKDKP